MKKFTKEELEQMSYDDLAYELLKDYGQKMKIMDLFNQIIEILNLSKEEVEKYIADFFELLSTDKRFIMLENGYWDLRINHSHKVIIDDDDEEFIEELDSDASDDDKSIDDVEENPEEDPEEDDLKDLVILNEDEIDEMS